MATAVTEATASEVETPRPPEAHPERKRCLALDAFRGFIMLVPASRGFGFSALQGDPVWGTSRWFDHVPWEGGVFRDDSAGLCSWLAWPCRSHWRGAGSWASERQLPARTGAIAAASC